MINIQWTKFELKSIGSFISGELSWIGFLNPKESDNGFCVSLLNRSWIDLFSKETQNPFSDSFGFKNPILDFLEETHPFWWQTA